MRYLPFLIIVFYSFLGQAHRFDIEQFHVIKTSPMEFLYAIYMDSQGMLWMGTDFGLKVYDGYKITEFKSDMYTPAILPNNEVRCLTEDMYHCLWIGTQSGLVKLDKKTGQFISYAVGGQMSQVITTLSTDSKGVVWVGTEKGLYYVSYEDNQVLPCITSSVQQTDSAGMQTPMHAVSVTSIVEDGQGGMFVGTWSHGLFRYLPQQKTFYRYPDLNLKNSVFSICLDHLGQLWVGSWGQGLVRICHPLDNEKMTIVNYPCSEDFDTYYRIIEDYHSHTLWLGSRGGLCLVDLDDETFRIEHHKSVGGASFSFSRNAISDQHGNVWLGTASNGIYQFNTNLPLVHYHKPDFSHQDTPIKNIKCLYTWDGEHFLLGAYLFGLNLYNTKTHRSLLNEEIPWYHSLPHQLKRERFMAIEACKNELWLGNWNGLVVLDRGNTPNNYKNWRLKKFIPQNVTALKQSSSNRMWIGSSYGLSYVSLNNSKPTLVHVKEHTDFPSCYISHIMEDHNQQLWLSTTNEGIICISNAASSEDRFVYKRFNSSRNNFPVNEATACFEDSKQRIWAISKSGGLFLFNAETEKFDNKNQDYGLEDSSFQTINEDEGGNLWLSTADGLVRLYIDGDSPTLTFYNRENILHNTSVIATCSFIHNNQIYYGNHDGFFTFNEGYIKQPVGADRPLVVTDLILDGYSFAQLDSTLRSSISAEMPSYMQRIVIPHRVQQMEIEFALLTYAGARYNRYAYYLEGYHSDWKFCASKSNRAVFSKLPVGSFQLHLKAADSYGNWVELPYTIQIEVLPPWWKSPWAYSLYVVLFLLGVYAVVRMLHDKKSASQPVSLPLSEEDTKQETMVYASLSSTGEAFLEKATACVMKHLQDASYTREAFAADMCMSGSSLYIKIRSVTGQTVVGFIISIRLKEACRLIQESPQIQINEVAERTGFNSSTYFARCFKKEYGILPAEYQKKLRR